MALKNNPLDDIVKCNVEIAEPASDDASFDSILVVVAAPTAAGRLATTKAFAVSSADELLEYGYTTNDEAYQAAQVAFSQNPAPDKLYFAVRRSTETVTDYYAQSASGVSGALKIVADSATPSDGEIRLSAVTPVRPTTWTPAVNDYALPRQETVRSYESVSDTLSRADAEAAFYGIHLSEFRTQTDLETAIAWAEANEKILGFEYTNLASCPVQNFSYYRTFGIFSGQADGYAADAQPKVNEFAALAWMAKCFGYDPGSETWHLKTLATIVPSALSASDKTALAQDNINSFLRYAGSNVTVGGKMLAGEWIDVIRFRDWLKNALQVNVFNALKTNRKVPYTDEGITMVQGVMEATLASGQTVGGIATTQYDEEGNEIPGYTVTVPRSADLTDVQRKSRKLVGCRYTARLAGAIHAVEIDGYLTF